MNNLPPRAFSRCILITIRGGSRSTTLLATELRRFKTHLNCARYSNRTGHNLLLVRRRKLVHKMTESTLLPSSLASCIKQELPVPLTKIQLHVHLDGAGRPETLYELTKAKKLPLPGDGSFRDFKKAIQVHDPKDLMHFLSGFQYFAPAFGGDAVAIERLAHEFCEDEARNGVAYVEARYSPHLMAGEQCGAEEVIKAVLRGFARGEKDFGIKARVILCCIRGRPDNEWNETLALCDKYRNKGVLAIDVAGDEGSCVDPDPWKGIRLDPIEKEVFTKAKEMGIRRTAHAGEAGPAQSVIQALDELHAERIGHGYHAIDDPKVYERCLKEDVHFEACPTSSLLTGAVSLAAALSGRGHPIMRFASDNANFSLNTDDPTITGTGLMDEHDVVKSWGLSDVHIVRSTFNALRSCFLPEEEKEELRAHLLKQYGITK